MPRSSGRARPRVPQPVARSLTGIPRHSPTVRRRLYGLVVAEAEGRRMRYELAHRRLGHALDDLLELALAVDPDAACAADEHGTCA